MVEFNNRLTLRIYTYIIGHNDIIRWRCTISAALVCKMFNSAYEKRHVQESKECCSHQEGSDPEHMGWYNAQNETLVLIGPMMLQVVNVKIPSIAYEVTWGAILALKNNQAPDCDMICAETLKTKLIIRITHSSNYRQLLRESWHDFEICTRQIPVQMRPGRPTPITFLAYAMEKSGRYE